MNAAILSQRNFPQFVQIANVVDFVEETWLLIIAALYDVLSDAGKVESGLSWHDEGGRRGCHEHSMLTGWRLSAHPDNACRKSLL
ncbi:hypothetical protein [Oleiagrimonas sp. C23AA]|uniref:hypothetical protein n=1 Tax=Oleiagrimonas sp. C23AA TaxID=2719047 RepID=UPI0031B6F3C5